jgi:hypothetical protein
MGKFVAAAVACVLLGGCASGNESAPTASRAASTVESAEPNVSPSPSPEPEGSEAANPSDSEDAEQVGDFEQYRSLYKEYDVVLMALQNRDKETLDYLGVSEQGCEAAIDALQKMLNTPESSSELPGWRDTSLKASIALARELIGSGLLLREPPVVSEAETNSLFVGSPEDEASDPLNGNTSFMRVTTERRSISDEELADLRKRYGATSNREAIWIRASDEFAKGP